ncbi:MAG: Pr6Pr family membrane protein [Gammaproteobacteria bacterium]
MIDGKINRIAAWLLAAFGWVALGTQLVLSVQHQMSLGHSAGYGVFMYTGYFTILTNLFCTIVATAFCKPLTPESRWATWREPWVVTAAAVSIVMVGLIFHVLLRAQYQPTGIAALTNLIHHYIVPVVFAIFWWRVIPRRSLVWADVWRVFAYPAAYLVYVLMRGEIGGVYPYFFIDVRTLGYAAVLVNASAISALFIGAGLAFVAAKR